MRALLALSAEGPDALPGLLTALTAALAGTGPALLPLPADPVQAARIVAALRPDEPLEDDAVAVVVPTSGSTGEPKGALLSAAALTASAEAAGEALGGPGRWVLAIPPTHIGGLGVCVRALLAGSPPIPLAAGSFTAETFAGATALLPSGGRRFTSLVPAQLRRLVAAGEAGLAAAASYDAVLLGGAAAPATLLAAARGAGVRVVTTYGMSETSGGCVYDGVALPGVTVDLVDGQVLLGGRTLAGGYRLRPDLAAAAFVGRWFRTGDLGRWAADGRLEVLGRADDVVVTGGEKVAPAAVEAALSGHPAVAEVVVVGVPDAEWGERVVAAVVLRAGASLTLAQAREHVAARVSRVAAPRELRVVAALPLLPSGKPDRAAVRSQTP